MWRILMKDEDNFNNTSENIRGRRSEMAFHLYDFEKCFKLKWYHKLIFRLF